MFICSYVGTTRYSIVHTIVHFLEISRRDELHRTVAYREQQKLDVFQRDSRALRVFVTRAADPPPLLAALSLFPSSPRSDGCYSTRSATFPRTKARKRGVVAWAGGQSYRGGWLAPVNGFRGQWRYTARSHGPSPKNYEPASTASFRGGRIFSLLALDLESRRRQKRKKRSRLRPRLPSRFFHVITISFSCFSIVLLDTRFVCNEGKSIYVSLWIVGGIKAIETENIE